MKRWVLTIAAVALAATGSMGSGHLSGPFDQKLPAERKIIHALNRLTFGPRPGSVEDVQRIGLHQWIELQLHPDEIPENPVLLDRLKPLVTLQMTAADIVSKYTPQQPNPGMMPGMVAPVNMNTLLPGDEFRKVMNGTAEERSAVLKSLDPEKRKQVLAMLPPNVIQYTPEFKQEAETARRERQEQIQAEVRKRNPQLQDLLNPDQLLAVRTGNRDEIRGLLAYLDPDKRERVASLLPLQSLAELPDLRREAQSKRTPRLVPSEDLKEAKVFRAVYSNRQLEEVLVDFWINHFNVDINKTIQGPNFLQTPNLMHLLIGSYERDAIRPHVLGHFEDLLLAVARHPAMLYYLDNWESVTPGAFEVGPFAPRRGFVNGVGNRILPGPFGQAPHGLNENYGREVMELHTLGVNGGYTQNDVINVARCFTGWTVRDMDHPEFVFAPFMHDFGEKTVLGHKIPAGRGEQDGLDVIDILAHHPSTAKFISRELAQRFVADDPPQSLVARMAQTFVKTDGDLRAVLETMFDSPEFFSEGAWQAKIKSPFETVVSAVRALPDETIDTYALVQKIGDLGEPLYARLEPTGYPNTGESWLGTQGLMGRMNFAASLTSGLIPGVKVDAAKLPGGAVDSLARNLLGHDAARQTLASLESGLQGKEATPAFVASLVLGSPDFQRR
jgi:uncharacterized protein (DUF1800 family)